MHDKEIEAMARAAWNSQWPDYPWDAGEYEGAADCRKATEAALTALCTLHPGVAALLSGEAVAVPAAGPTPEMRRATWLTQYWLANETLTRPASIEAVIHLIERRLTDDRQRESDDLAYLAMLAASPWAQEETRDAE